MFKKLITLLIAAAPLWAGAQTIVDMQFKQNPLFKVSTNQVNTAMTDAGTLTLGGDLTVAGGSGVYSYAWTDADGAELGSESTLTISVPGKYILTVSDQCDCSQTVEFNIEAAAIEAVEVEGLELKVVGDWLLIGGAEARQVTVFAMNGSMALLASPAEPVGQVSLASLEPGVYVAQVLLADGRLVTSKFSIR